MASNVQHPFEGVLVDASLWSKFDMSLERAIAKVQEPGAEDEAFAEMFGFAKVSASAEVNASANEYDSAHSSVSASDDDSADGSTQTDKGKNDPFDKHGSFDVSANSTAGTSKTRPFIEFPAEIHLKLFDLLCPVNSTVLGLTCKKFYKIHRTYHGAVSLMLRSSSR
ncbi:hypothetical protein BDZ45DRAFT_723280 [Acephala macrosclerotiorum]|nr:hypothetical protein BDZ45DRAFT_723280 [Acephala macrosclerotiorum]